jgi:hypothetical protein
MLLSFYKMKLSVANDIFSPPDQEDYEGIIPGAFNGQNILLGAYEYYIDQCAVFDKVLSFRLVRFPTEYYERNEVNEIVDREGIAYQTPIENTLRVALNAATRLVLVQVRSKWGKPDFIADIIKEFLTLFSTTAGVFQVFYVQELLQAVEDWRPWAGITENEYLRAKISLPNKMHDEVPYLVRLLKDLGSTTTTLIFLGHLSLGKDLFRDIEALARRGLAIFTIRRSRKVPEADRVITNTESVKKINITLEDDATAEQILEAIIAATNIVEDGEMD